MDARGELAGPVLLHNEFASVTAETEVRRGGTCLRLVDTQSGVTGLLDPIVLEALAWANRDELEAFTLGVLGRTTRFSVDGLAGDGSAAPPVAPVEP